MTEGWLKVMTLINLKLLGNHPYYLQHIVTTC